MAGGSFAGDRLLEGADRQENMSPEEVRRRQVQELLSEIPSWSDIYTEMMEQPLKKPLKRFMSEANLEAVLKIYNDKVESEVAKPWFQRLKVTLPEEMLIIEKTKYGAPAHEWDKPEAVWKKEYEESEKEFLKEVLEKTLEIGAIAEAISSNGQATMMQIIKETKELLKLLRLRKLSNNAHMMWFKGENVSMLENELEKNKSREEAEEAELELKQAQLKKNAGRLTEFKPKEKQPMGPWGLDMEKMRDKGWDRLVDDPS